MFSLSCIHQGDSVEISPERLTILSRLVADGVDIPQKGVLNIAFISDDTMRELNHTHRNIDTTTDVLSFHYFEDFTHLKKEEVAGEIVLSESRILDQSREHGHSPERETEILVLHGVLHILGFDHETDEDYEVMWSHESIMREDLLLTN